MDLRTNAGSNPVLGSALMVLTVLNSQARTRLRQALACAAEHPGASLRRWEERVYTLSTLLRLREPLQPLQWSR